MVLEDGVLKTSKKTPYAKETQVVIKHIIRKLYKWMHNDQQAEALTGWFDTSVTVTNKEYLTIQEVETIRDQMMHKTPEQWALNRALLTILMDTGMRVNELQNIRLKHVITQGEDTLVNIEVSKTKPRTLLLSQISETYVKKWLAIHPANNHPEREEAQLIPISYTAIKGILYRAGKKIRRHITPHTMRRSAATYWAQHIGRYDLCYRFGWSMSSKEPDRYIQRKGLGQDKIKGIINKDTQERQEKDLHEENKQLRNELTALKQRQNQIEQEELQQIREIIAHVKKTGWMPPEAHQLD